MKLLSTVMILLMTIAGQAQAELWIVDLNGGGDFLTIQEAILCAASGDQILVKPGTYVENIDFLGKDLEVFSAAGSAITFIDGGSGPPGDASCVRFVSGEPITASLAGFTFIGGMGSTHLDNTAGGGVLCVQSAATIRDCVFQQNSAGRGGGLRSYWANMDISDCLFEENEAQLWGAAVSCGYSVISISGSQFIANHSAAGDGALSFGDNNSFLVEACEFRGNSGPCGAGLDVGQGSSTGIVRYCLFKENQAKSDHGGGLRIHEANPTVEYCTFIGNTANLDGGGMMILDGADPIVRNCTFYRNSALRYGGNIAVWYASQPTIENCIVADAEAGGGLFFEMSTGTLTCNDAWNNVGGDYVGIPDPTGSSGNICVDPSFCDPQNDDLTLCSSSPCAAPNNPECGQIGAHEIGCQPSAVQEVTWGAIKAIYR